VYETDGRLFESSAANGNFNAIGMYMHKQYLIDTEGNLVAAATNKMSGIVAEGILV
jgi:hypothetical protein